MHTGRRLLFHRRNVDDSIGTYATDYVLAGFCFFLAGLLIYKISRSRAVEEVHSSKGRTRASRLCLPWNYPGDTIVSVTMASYATVLFASAYGAMGFLGGMPHEFLQKVEPYSTTSDGLVWLILWRCGAGSSIFAALAFMILCEQLCQQESFLALPLKVRKVYYVVLFLVIAAALVENFVRVLGDDPYNITTLFLAVMAFVLVYGSLTAAITIRSFFKVCKQWNEAEYEKKCSYDECQPSSSPTLSERGSSTRIIRWDLVLHALCPWIIISGGIFSFVLTPYCSHHEDPHKLHGCPLPNEFNHNAVMHLVHVVAVVCVVAGENLAINRRGILCERNNLNKALSNREDSTDTWLLV